jgi:hypothetical protein
VSSCLIKTFEKYKIEKTTAQVCVFQDLKPKRTGSDFQYSSSVSVVRCSTVARQGRKDRSPLPKKLTLLSRGRIFSQAGNELGASSFLAGNEFLNDFPLHIVPSWERARSRTD